MNGRKFMGFFLAAMLSAGLTLPGHARGQQEKPTRMVRVQPPPIVSAAAAPATGAEKEVLDFINTFGEVTSTQTREGKAKDTAALTRDQAAAARMLSDDYVFVNTSGQALSKQVMLRETHNQLSFRGFSDLGHDIKIHGNVAILTGTFSMTGVLNGKRITGRFRGTQILVKESAGWVAVAGSVAKLPATAK